MKAKTKFLKMFYKLPQKARTELAYNWWHNTMNMRVIAEEIKRDTKLGQKILKDLGYEND